jgi:WD40 repeat protein
VTWWRTNVHAPVGSNVHAIAVGRDRVAIATEAGPIFIFDRSGAQIAIVPGHEGGTEALAYSADGLLASGGQDRSIRLWRDGRAVGELPGPTGDTYFVMFAHDALISAGDDGVVRAWTVHGDTATSPRIVGSHVGAVTAIAIGGDYVASVGRDATVTRSRLDSTSFETAKITDRGSLGLSIDAHGHVLIASANGDVEHWDAQVTTTSSTTTTTAAVALGTAIVLGGLDGTVRVVSQP